MSVRLISAVWSDAPYEGGVLLVLLALADYCNDNGECWPRVDSIAKKARLTERQVYSILRQLKTDGVLTVQSGGGRGISSRYKINPETLKPNSLNSTSLKSEAETLKSTTQNPEICSSAIRKNRQEPSIEPSGVCQFCGNSGFQKSRAHPGRQIYCHCDAGMSLQRKESPASPAPPS